jgi:hypothetical protein
MLSWASKINLQPVPTQGPAFFTGPAAIALVPKSKLLCSILADRLLKKAYSIIPHDPATLSLARTKFARLRPIALPFESTRAPKPASFCIKKGKPVEGVADSAGCQRDIRELPVAGRNEADRPGTG